MGTSVWKDFIVHLQGMLPDISREIDEGLSEIEDDPNELALLYQEALCYQGFDGAKIMAKFISKAREHNDSGSEVIRISEKIKVKGVEKDFVYSDKEKYSTDLLFLLTLFLTRGSVSKKYTSKTLQPIQRVLNMLSDKYDLHEGGKDPGTIMDPLAISLPRLASIVPTKVCELLDKKIGKVLTQLDDLGLTLVPNGRNCVMTPHFTSIIPRKVTKKDNTCLMYFFLVHVIYDDVLHRKDQKKSSLRDILTYFSAAFRSDMTSEELRVKFCIRMGLLTANSEGFIPVIVNASSTAEDKIRDRRPSDITLNEVISELKKMKE